MSSNYDAETSGKVWERLQDAEAQGRFVPVLGFDLACKTEYNSSPLGVANGALGEELAQQHEAARAAARVRLAVKLLKLESVKPYLESFVSVGDAEDPDAPPDSKAELTSSPVFLRLLANLATLSFDLTQTWAAKLSEQPRPIGETFEGGTQVAASVQARVLMHLCLGCCAVLHQKIWPKGYAGDEEAREPNALKLHQVYVKLLFLSSELFPGPAFWDAGNPCLGCPGARSCKAKRTDTVMTRQGKFASQHSGISGWTGTLQRDPHSKGNVGVRLSHLLWLQGLLQHLLLAGTQAYRTQDQLAFLLVLDDAVKLLPDATADPFEILCLRTAEDFKTLTDVLGCCEGIGNTSSARTAPPPFHAALAKFLKQARQTASDSDDPLVSSRANDQVVLAMGLDREFERAVAREFGVFRVAVPAFRQVLGPPSPDGKEINHVPCWLIGECRQDPEVPIGYRVRGWVEADHTDPATLTHDGPLIVKMFGSPLEALPAANSGNFSRPADMPETGKIWHRLVLDETALLASLLRHLPETYADLGRHLATSVLFFFGQDAKRWSERVPYFLARSLADRELNDEGAVVPGVDARRADEPLAVSIGGTGLVGCSALGRLCVVPIAEAEEVEVVQLFMRNVIAPKPRDARRGRRRS